MKILIPLLVLSSVVAPSAIAGDSKETLREHLAFCRGFMIQDPDPRIAPNDLANCCFYGNSQHDCYIYDWNEISR